MSRPLWINVGELSGDIQAAALVRELRKFQPNIEIVGMGGENLAAAGQKNLFTIDQLSVMGILEVLTVLPRAIKLLSQIKKSLQEIRPRAVLLVDAPEFHFRIARAASKLGIPVYYFIPPKIWAWRSGRIAFLKKYIKRIFCILPFELEWYHQRGVNVDYVGNPLLERINLTELDKISPEEDRIGLMPGSRHKEVESLLPIFAQTAKILLKKHPHLSFHCLRAPNMTESKLRTLWKGDIPLIFDEPQERYLAMRKCQIILAASGTATLETGLLGIPTIVTYKVSYLSSLVGRLLIKVPWVSLTNLILNREVFPELLQERANPQELADSLEKYLDNGANCVVKDLKELRKRCDSHGRCAARDILQALEGL